MSIKIEFEKDIHIFKGDEKNFAALCQYVSKAFPEAPRNFELYYFDSDGDIITISNDQDLKMIVSDSKCPKLYLRESQKSAILAPTSDEEDDKEVEIVGKNQKRFSPSPRHSGQNLKPVSEKDLKKILKQQKKDKKQKQLREAVQREINSLMPQITAMVAQQLGVQAPSVPINVQMPLLSTSTPSCSIKTPTTDECLGKEVHAGYVCDGCDGAIIGARYKSAVLEDFDLCEDCERTKGHEYPLIKIARPQQAPKAIITVINEDDNSISTRTSDNEFLRSIIDSQLVNVGDFFQEINVNGPARNSRAPEKSSTPVVPREQPSNEAVLIASVVGGDAYDYEDLVKNCRGLEIDDMIEAALSFKEMKNSKKHIEEPVREEKEKSFKLKEQKPEVEKRGRKQQEEQPSSKKYTWTEVMRGKEIQSIMGGEDLDYYCEIVKNNPRMTVSAIVEELLETNVIYTEIENKKLDNQGIPERKKEEVRVVDEIKKVVRVPSPKKEIQPPVQKKVPPPKRKESLQKKNQCKVVQKKAENIASVCGGNPEDYFTLIESMRNVPADDIIIDILNARECEAKQEEQAVVDREERKREKEAVVRKIEKEEIIVPVKEEPQVEIPAKKYKKNFSNLVKQKGDKIAEIIGGNPEDYYGVVDAFCFSTINDIVEMIFNDQSVLIKYSSFASE